MNMQPPTPDPAPTGIWRGIVSDGETGSRQNRPGAGVALREGALVLADGSVFEGELIGAEAQGGVATGEVVFNTVLSGYQEVITDPSYAGQIIAFTNPHIGNYGVSTADFDGPRTSTSPSPAIRIWVWGRGSPTVPIRFRPRRFSDTSGASVSP